MAEEPKRLPSGLWSTRVRLPNGRRPRITHELKSVVIQRADDLRADVRRGDWIDPELARLPVEYWWEKGQKTWMCEDATWKRHRGWWKNHVGPYWMGTPLGGILKPDVTEWVKTMSEAGHGPTTIEHAITLLRLLCDLAVDSRAARFNATTGVTAPRRHATTDRIITADEEAALFDALDLLFPGRLDARPFVEVLFDTGGRYQDAAGIIKGNIDRLTGMVHLTGVMPRTGVRRSTMKTDGQEVTRGRHVLLTPPTLSLLSARLDSIGLDDLVFMVEARSRETGEVRMVPLDYHNWRHRIWLPALTVARVCRGKWSDCRVEPPQRLTKWSRKRPAYCQVAEHAIPEPHPTPHDTRHTFGTRLAKGGVPKHEIQALLGHSDSRSTERYIHADEDRFKHVLAMRGTRG